jgi:hypothetical protein
MNEIKVEIDNKYRTLFKNSIRGRICHEIDITDDHFNFIHKWLLIFLGKFAA